MTKTSVKQKADKGAKPVDEYGRAATLAQKALELAETYQTPPVPETYEVWYTYAGGEDPLIAKQIDSMIGDGKTIGSYDIGQLHAQCLSREARGRDQLSAANRKLDQEMDDILSFIQSHLSSSESYSGSLAEGAKGLSDDASPATIRQTIEMLMEENRTMRSDTKKLTNSLEQSKAQIQELRTNLAKSRENEMRDPLTSIANRRRFEICLAEEVERSRTSKKSLCLVYADLDHFKRVNDEFGHLIGDEVLKYFAGLLAKSLRKGDLAARYGGEEFAVIMPETTVDEAMQIMEVVREKLQKTKLVVTESNQSLGSVTASFGVALFSDSDDIAQLMKRADANLYTAKSEGRDRVYFGEAIAVDGGRGKLKAASEPELRKISA